MGEFLEKTWWIWIIGMLLAIVFCVQKCNDAHSDLHTSDGDGFNVVVVDSCEYLIRTSGYQGYLAHKGNCKFCAERMKQFNLNKNEK